MNGERQFRNLLLHIISRSATATLAIAVIFALTVVLTPSVQAQTPSAGGTWTEQVLLSFDGTDGADPLANLIFDAAGNLYGTTYAGGSYGLGTVFELTPSMGGGWTEKVLHNFGQGSDGSQPAGGLIFDAAGRLYGTTYFGGSNGYGTVFQLIPSAGGDWTEKVLHSFSGTDGSNPVYGSLTFDAAGNLYGTTYAGGSYGLGTVFELTPNPHAIGGSWAEKVLHNFGQGSDGSQPENGLIFDAAGNLYGTTYAGGSYGVGAVFELTPSMGGGWSEKVLHNFGQGSDGSQPVGGLIFDAAGRLYGTTQVGGSFYHGTVFELTPEPGGDWTEKVLHNFSGGADGAVPNVGLIFDAAHNLYGTTDLGGAYGWGTVFELAPSPHAVGGGWTAQVLHNFGQGSDGADPYGTLILDPAGNLYGVTEYGGAYHFYDGTVFELIHN